MKVFFKTFGCRTNIYDTELLRSYFGADELATSEATADFVVVNSCTVTNGADSDVRNYLRRVARSGKRAVLAGCGAVSKGRELYASGLVWGVLGGENKARLAALLSSGERFFELGGLRFSDARAAGSFESHTKAFLKIQEGCNFNCSYCIIPQVRGGSRSVDMGVLLSQAQRLAADGFSEIVLTGTNIGSFKPSLGELLARLGGVAGVRRVRLGSVEPSQIDESFLEVCGEDFVEKHLHIALQHTSDEMLQLMRRRNRVERDLRLFGELAARGFALGTDFIVAHPGESEAVWAEAMRNAAQLPLTHIHAFVFSPRQNTHSQALLARFGAINGAVAKARMGEITGLVAEKNFAFRERLARQLAAGRNGWDLAGSGAGNSNLGVMGGGNSNLAGGGGNPAQNLPQNPAQFSSNSNLAHHAAQNPAQISPKTPLQTPPQILAPNLNLSVLVEKKDGEFWVGFDEFYNKCFIKSGENLSKKWVKIHSFRAAKEGNYATFFTIEKPH